MFCVIYLRIINEFLNCEFYLNMRPHSRWTAKTT